ncbi:MAG: 3-hydroxyacyl-CoA dehydrogenase family protein [Bryobacteraceae bacterium]|nr:3-hydroxyacyl-CoA dehydrogenase family protein [Bryobacteraceae bacterium]
MSENRFQTAAAIGTGMMGPGIALTFALGGLGSTILSRNADTARAGLDKALAQLQTLETNGLASPESAEAARGRLTASADFDAVIRQADLVVESGPEDMKFKQDLFARMDAIARPDAVLASNTSGLSITDIASRSARRDRILTTHFWNPPYLMPLVELVKGRDTADALVEDVRRLLERCGKVAVVVKKDTPGQLGNRLQMALVREAVHIVQEGIADAESVDLAAKTGFGLRLPVYGILEHQDMVGLDLGSRVLDYVTSDLNSDAGLPPLMREMMERGELGVKTGKGFYDWSKRDAEAVKARRDRFVLAFLKAGL